VKVRGSGAQTPEGSRTQFGWLSVGLGNTVIQAAHVMQEQIGEKMDGFKGQGRRDRAGAGLHRRFVAGHAVDRCEQLLAPGGLRAQRHRWRRSQELHEVGKPSDVILWLDLPGEPDWSGDPGA